MRKILLRFLYYLLGKPFRTLLRLRFSRVPLQLHLGCGLIRKDGFINIDKNWSPAADMCGDVSNLFARDSTVERIETYHVLEHIPFPKVGLVLSEWFRVLQPGGVLVIECPDFDSDVKSYLNGEEEILFSIFGRHRYREDVHCWGYNERRLEKILRQSGFSTVRFSEPQERHATEEPCLRVEAVK